MKHVAQLTVLLFASWGVAQSTGGAGSARNLTVWEPPNVDWPSTLPKPTVAKEMVKGLSVAGWPITLEETEVDEARKHFGGTLGGRGDAGESLGWLCLYRQGEGASWVLWLESAEINGPTIGSFRWQQLPSQAKIDRRCQRLKTDSAAIDLPLAIRLGMTEAEVVSRMGKPSAQSGERAIYLHEHNLTIDGEPYSLDNYLLITYRNGRVWAIDVSHSTVS